MFESTLHRAAETVRSEAFASLACPCAACHGRASPAPQPILSCAARSPQARPASAFFPKMSPSKPSCPLSRYRPGLQTFLQPAGACGRPMGSDSHPRILRLAPPSPQRIDYPYLSRLLRQNHSSFLEVRDHCTGSEFHSATRASIPSYTPLSGLHWKPGASVVPAMGRRSALRPLSCGHHPAACWVIPSFREGVYFPATDASLWSASLRHNTAFFAFRRSGQRSRAGHRALASGIPGAFPQCGRSGCSDNRKSTPLRAVFIPFMH